MDANGYFFQARTDDDEAVVTIAGDIDLSVAARLWEDLRVWFAPHRRVLVDCSAITFIDSMGLRVLIQAAHAAEQSDVAFALMRPSAAVTTVLDLSGTADMFTITEGIPATEPE